MIKFSSELPLDVFTAIQEQAQKTPALVKRGVARVTRPIDRRMLAELQAQPPVWEGKRRWKSEKQRKAFFATDGFKHGIPYKRTGGLSKAWKVNVIFTQDGGEIISENKTPAARYVQGDDTQPMHLDSGWPQAAPIYNRYLPIYEDALIEFWFVIVDLFAGVPQR